jgi:hypothetical protein
MIQQVSDSIVMDADNFFNCWRKVLFSGTDHAWHMNALRANCVHGDAMYAHTVPTHALRAYSVYLYILAACLQYFMRKKRVSSYLV